MKTLFLLRHAKSAWDDPTLADHDRPLAPRGRRAAATMAKYLAERKAGPPRLDLVVCSTARRARETWDRMVDAWPARPPVVFEDGLYLCGGDALLDRLRALPESVVSVMLVGHNPDLHELAVGLAPDGHDASAQALRTKLPTGSFVEIALPEGPWADLAWGRGRLAAFVTPRSLD